MNAAEILGPEDTADLFSGARGWDVAARQFGIDPVGFEKDADACATARAAGMPTVEVDLTDITPPPALDGLIASPPCQSFSSAGKRTGLADERGQLVWLPLRWIEAARPRWVALEQVPEVLPIWQDYRRRMVDMGYFVWCGILDAERYGVPQTRSRAILIAHRYRPVTPPAPTHQKYVHDVPRGDPHACGLDNMFDAGVKAWVSMHDAVGWPEHWMLEHPRGEGMIERHGERPLRSASDPSMTVTSKGRSWILHRPATTVTTDSRIATPGHHDEETRSFDGDAVKLTPREAAVLQTFPADHPWQGSNSSQFRQIGNAIPPMLAAAVLGQVVTPVASGDSQHTTEGDRS